MAVPLRARRDPVPVKLPAPSDAQRLRARLAEEERALAAALAALEERLRRFADVERPAYESWRRLELGPELATLDELEQQIRARQVLAERVQTLAWEDGFEPREALYAATHPDARAPRGARDRVDPEEVRARRRAKVERKRAARKQARREARTAERVARAGAVAGSASAARKAARVVDLYRALARRIHPDSPSAVRGLDAARLGAIWADVQAAYEGRSLERLLALSAWVEGLEGAEGADGAAPPLGAGAAGGNAILSLSERYERLRALRRSRGALERKVAELRLEPAWEFAGRRGAARRRLAAEARRAVESEIDRARRDLAELEAFFAAIGTPRPPRRSRGR